MHRAFDKIPKSFQFPSPKKKERKNPPRNEPKRREEICKAQQSINLAWLLKLLPTLKVKSFVENRTLARSPRPMPSPRRTSSAKGTKINKYKIWRNFSYELLILPSCAAFFTVSSPRRGRKNTNLCSAQAKCFKQFFFSPLFFSSFPTPPTNKEREKKTFFRKSSWSLNFLLKKLRDLHIYLERSLETAWDAMKAI